MLSFALRHTAYRAVGRHEAELQALPGFASHHPTAAPREPVTLAQLAKSDLD